MFMTCILVLGLITISLWYMYIMLIIFSLFKVEAVTISLRLRFMIKGYGKGHCISHCVHLIGYLQ